MIRVGDCIEVMRGMAVASVDAIVTDPPYGLAFMGKRWDYNVPGVEAFAEMLRVLKPGGRLLCFAGTRTMHRMWVNIEDAGFTIEDSIAWMYGSGFPKHRSKLKPAYEPICVARRGPVTALNIDECRIGVDAGDPNHRPNPSPGNNGARSMFGVGGHSGNLQSSGRWPANVALTHHEDCDGECHADCPVRLLDEQSGDAGGGFGVRGRGGSKYAGGEGFANSLAEVGQTVGFGDSGGASRFFYTAKASRSERGEDNHHPTVKPVKLMRWLVRLVTPEGGTVLDPFAGSGTTGIAATLEGFDFVGIEREQEYAEIAERRIAHWAATHEPDLLRGVA